MRMHSFVPAICAHFEVPMVVKGVVISFLLVNVGLFVISVHLNLIKVPYGDAYSSS